jgi:hypothetical protein
MGFPRGSWPLFALGLLLQTGCSGPRIAVNMTAPILRNTTAAALRSEDPQLVGDALPTSLLLLEGMLETHPGHSDIAIQASLLYFSYAFAFVEAEDPARASRFYDRGRELGWRGFGKRHEQEAITEGSFEEVHAALKKVRRKHAEALLWVAANWGMWIQLNLESTRAAADLARLMPLVERVAELDENLMWGLPRILLGALHAGRPVMLGGNSERARQEFERAFEISDRNMLLAQVLFAKFYCLQTFDRDSFESSLREVLNAPKGQLPNAELLNQIAQLQAERLLEQVDEIFE